MAVRVQVPGCVAVASEDESATSTGVNPVRQLDAGLGFRPATTTTLCRLPGVERDHGLARLGRLPGQRDPELAPPGVGDAAIESRLAATLATGRHVLDGQLLDADAVVGRHQCACHLVVEVGTLVGHPNLDAGPASPRIAPALRSLPLAGQVPRRAGPCCGCRLGEARVGNIASRVLGGKGAQAHVDAGGSPARRHRSVRHLDPADETRPPSPCPVTRHGHAGGLRGQWPRPHHPQADTPTGDGHPQAVAAPEPGSRHAKAVAGPARRRVPGLAGLEAGTPGRVGLVEERRDRPVQIAQHLLLRNRRLRAQPPEAAPPVGQLAVGVAVAETLALVVPQVANGPTPDSTLRGRHRRGCRYRPAEQAGQVIGRLTHLFR